MARARASVLAVCLSGPLLLAGPAGAAEAEDRMLNGGPASAEDSRPIPLDTSVFLPDSLPAPAVVLAHGFGGSKADLTSQARDLADAGYLVVTYSARGFGESGGQISMNSPEFEVADASAIVDQLATMDEVQKSGADPVVAFAGSSYGGALSLLVAGHDPRIDAVIADITWNDLESSLFAQSAAGEGAGRPGVFKELWTGVLFGAGAATRVGAPQPCGRLSPQWCDAYLAAAETGQVTPEGTALMRASSPISVTDRITAPTLLIAGQSDSLFPIAQANATAAQIADAHPQVPVAMAWRAGGHDGGADESAEVADLTLAWLDTHLRGAPGTVPAFSVTEASGAISLDNSRAAPQVLVAGTYPGIHGSSQQSVALDGPAQGILAPAGGMPAAITALPGAGALTSLLGSGFTLVPTPGQSANFESAPLSRPLRVVGASTVELDVTRLTGSGPGALFASLRIVGADGRERLPAGQVAPIRIADLAAGSTIRLAVELPAIVSTVAAGERLRLVFGTTDFAYLLPRTPSTYQVALASPTIQVPLVELEPVESGTWPGWWLVGAFAVVIVIAALVLALRPRSSPAQAPSLDPLPLRIGGLTKSYRNGQLAVDDLSFAVEPGMVLGLLGPNGAGKTTTLRMVMGLITPDAGSISAFGATVHPGAAVLSQMGSFVEGPGFLPHLTGRQNLDLYWRSTGRTGPSYLEEVLAIADLGTALDRKVRTYSQGMRQRLGIAQAMLGFPSLLILDEPTNGLDPPQIKAMREVLQAYAASGRTVIVSSHLLSEVEQSCTHVVVMHRGRLLASGRVDDLLSDDGRRLEDVFLEIVGDDLTIGLR